MKRGSDASLLFYATIIYAISALLLPGIFEVSMHAVIGMRVIPGEGDALESIVRWPIVGALVAAASVVPLLLLSMRFSALKSVIFSLLVAVLAELLISLFLIWLATQPLPQDYPILRTIQNLNSSHSWPYEADWHVLSSLLRIGVLPLAALGLASIKHTFTKNLFGKNLKSVVN
jgi:hypothetical protein